MGLSQDELKRRFQRLLDERRQRDLERRARRKKLRRKDRVRHRRVDKRKYYGVGVNEEQYKKLLLGKFDTDKILKGIQTGSNVGRERLFREDFKSDIDRVLRELVGLTVDDVLEIGEIFADTYLKGSRRVMNKEGEYILRNVEVGADRVADIVREQNTYFSNVVDEVSTRISDDIGEGVSKGLGNDEISDMIRRDVEDISRKRVDRIVRTEIVKASNQGTVDVMEEAGVERVIWLATLDNRTCETCRGFHETVWDIGDAPRPVQDSHPNCRCTLIVDVDADE